MPNCMQNLKGGWKFSFRKMFDSYRNLFLKKGVKGSQAPQDPPSSYALARGPWEVESNSLLGSPSFTINSLKRGRVEEFCLTNIVVKISLIVANYVSACILLSKIVLCFFVSIESIHFHLLSVSLWVTDGFVISCWQTLKY